MISVHTESECNNSAMAESCRTMNSFNQNECNLPFHYRLEWKEREQCKL